MITIMGIHIENREEVAGCVQSLLTDYGCMIRTRLGLHEAGESSCSPRGLIILEFFNENKERIEELMGKINKIDGANAKIMEF